MNPIKAFFRRATLLVVAVSPLMASQGAFAAGTVASTTISNTATVNYTVGGVAQTAINSNTSTFLVDRKVNLNVTPGSGTTTSPGVTNQALVYTVTNTGNDSDNFTLTAANLTGDNFDTTNLRIYRDNGDGVFNIASDTLVSGPVAFTPDQSIRFFVVSDIPVTAANGQTAQLSLTATTGRTASAGADTAGVDTVFADPGNNGTETANNTYTVATAALAVVKSSTVVSDPVAGTTNPHAIPGAVIQYTITVTNSSTTSAASAVVLTDAIPANTTYVANSMTLNAAALTDAADADGGTTTGTPVTSITVNAGTVAASGGTATATFRVTIN